MAEFKQLSDEDIRALVPQKINYVVYHCDIARKAENEILKQVVEWGDSPCKNEHHASGNYFKATHGYYCYKKSCFECWQELKGEEK